MHSSEGHGASEHLEEIAEGAFKCHQTGLIVRRPPVAPVWKVSGEFGPLNPPLREGEPTLKWSRFDSSFAATIYAAEDKWGAYHEALSYAERSNEDLAHTLASITGGMFHASEDRWSEQTVGPSTKPKIPQSWFERKWIVELDIESGWYVDICHPDTIGALRRRISEFLGIEARDVDCALLMQPNRRLTCFVADSLLHETLGNVETPSGVYYTSRHGRIACWAIWAPLFGVSNRTADVIKDLFRGKLRRDPVINEIDPGDPELLHAARNLGFDVADVTYARARKSLNPD